LLFAFGRSRTPGINRMVESTTMRRKMDLALEHYSSGRLRETEGLCREILGAQPQHAEALHLLGVLAHRTGHLDAAVELTRQAIANSPQRAPYYSNLAVMLTNLGRFDEAATACRDALARSPNLPEAHYNLGNVLQALGQPEAAIAAYRRALDLKPDYPQACCNLGNALSALSRHGEAAEAYREAVRLQPDYAQARSNLGNALRDLGRFDEALQEQRKAVESAPASPEIRSNMIVSLCYGVDVDPQVILGECRRWDQVHGEPLRAQIRRFANDPAPERRLRIGFVCPNLPMHSSALLLRPLLEARDRQNFHVTCYASNALMDGSSAQLRPFSDAWQSLAGLTDDAAAQRIRDDAIDILIDVSAHAAGNRLPLFARKLAPVQVTYLGCPGTTGLATMDYRLTDRYVDPPGDDRFSSETLIRLPDATWCFTPPSGSPNVTPLPAFDNGYVTFGSFNDIAKVTSHVLDLWARILQQVSGSHLLVKNAAFRNGQASARMRQFFVECGIEPERIELLPDEPSPSRALQQHAALDIALDTFPFAGVISTFLALWMGVPVVSFAGHHHLTRVGLSILSNAGLPELAARSDDGYVQTAVGLATDLPALSALRATLRRRVQHSALMDAARLAHNVEAAYRGMWRRWCTDASH
jgi:protein O-GlcNAc transferase